ncbi:MAG TPA: hypothetical protein VJN70_06265 [Gemmatimonadaceae bacterium]|nr:hypothetical protein [Gemmatimonadaceae bacterium]
MRFRPLTRHDAWRSIPQTLCMRGLGIVILAACGLLWPDLALIVTLVDIAIICLLFALADLFVAAAIRRESTSSARKIGALGLLGLSFGALTLSMIVMPPEWMRIAALVWLVASGMAIVLVGASFPSRGRSGGVLGQCGALQLAIAFLFVMIHPSRPDLVLHAGVTYAASLGGAQVALGLSLRRVKNVRSPWKAQLIEPSDESATA